jgi:hypothetical protein
MLPVRNLLVFTCALSFAGEAHANICTSIAALANKSVDASAALLNCIAKAAPGGRVELPVGTYVINTQMSIDKPVTITTAGLRDSDAGCDALGLARCARILIDVVSSQRPRSMPVQVNANGTSLVHLIIEGSTDARLRSFCNQPEKHPLAGGLRIAGSNFTFRKSVLRNFACYTAMEVLQGVSPLTIEYNLIGPNGDHSIKGDWSDGITIHDARDAIVRHNKFIDNTDVQLIFGGCLNCRIEQNQFRHSGSFSGASFAEIMLHTFPGKSGNFQGTVVDANDVDCGPNRRCGYGIMIGASPWRANASSKYPGGMAGGTISGNSIRNARIGINVDAPTGPVTISGNTVESSGGPSRSDCGLRDWPAVNVAPAAVPFVKGNPANQPAGHVSTLGCLLDRVAQ